MLFGMGSGGVPPLESPGKGVSVECSVRGAVTHFDVMEVDVRDTERRPSTI